MSTDAVMFHQALADELDLYITDHKCMDNYPPFWSHAGWKVR
jgi:hypothetical protein